MPVWLRERAVKEGFREEEVPSHATHFGQWKVSTSDLCQFQVEALRARMCFSVIPLFPLPQELPLFTEFPSSAQVPE